jgi:hypothetical protein
MPRKPRITAVPVEQPVLTVPVSDQREGLMVATDLPEEKTDAEQMTEILQEVQQEPKEEQKEADSDAVAISKPKAKRASRAKPKEEPQQVEPKEEKILTPVLTQRVADQREVSDQREQEPKEEAKIDDKVACPDCGKQMSAKTLKYSHVANCVTKKQNTNTDENKEVVTEAMIEHHLRTRARTERATRREAMVAKLMQTAF